MLKNQTTTAASWNTYLVWKVLDESVSVGDVFGKDRQRSSGFRTCFGSSGTALKRFCSGQRRPPLLCPAASLKAQSLVRCSFIRASLLC